MGNETPKSVSKNQNSKSNLKCTISKLNCILAILFCIFTSHAFIYHDIHSLLVSIGFYAALFLLILPAQNFEFLSFSDLLLLIPFLYILSGGDSNKTTYSVYALFFLFALQKIHAHFFTQNKDCST